ncbi:MAG TPA: hypothetical protein PKM63_01415 [Panacibacter sp.]|nr:hypothetical protein [Panacibacter sp.]HNP42913.1 hypothetical protein [Panacibacter sp.]
MNKSHSFKLIHGTFSPSGASEVLFGLISSKIHFHSMENFSSNERFGKDKPNSQRRIKALKKVQGSIKKIVEAADKKGKQLKIDGNIEITVIE